MTHFGVLVRIPAAAGPTPDAVMTALEQLMEPWQEHACTGECPQKFMTFRDDEDSYVDEYADGVDSFVDIGPAADGEKSTVKDGTNRNSLVLVHNGRRLVRSWHEMFRVAGSIGIGGNSHEVDDKYPRVEVPYKEIHPSLEDFARDYHGHKERDPIENRFGRWENPDKRWDYWRVIRARIPKLGSGDVDCARICELDGAVLAERTRERALAAVLSLEDIRAGRSRKDGRDPTRQDFFWEMNARGSAIEYGLLKCIVDGSPASAELEQLRATHRVVRQERNDKMVVFDVWDDRVTTDELMRRAMIVCHPLRMWGIVEADPHQRRLAADAGPLDPIGKAIDFEGGEVKGGSMWRQAGSMGWWAMHDATPEALLAHANNLIDWLRGGDQNDIVVAVDCHI